MGTGMDGMACIDAIARAHFLAASKSRGRSPVGRRASKAWRVSDELGWAKTYDAEDVALARLLDCRVVTADARLRRGADRLGLVLSVSELGA